MESITPPYHRSDPKNRTKSASRHARINQVAGEEAPHLSLELVPSSPNVAATPSPKSHSSLPLRELLLLLSPSPHKRSKTRLAERLEMVDQDLVEPNGSRRRSKSRNSSLNLLNVASPRNNRRSRRRLEQENREERDLGLVDEMAKPRKKRRSKKDKSSLVTSVQSPKSNEGDGCHLDRIGQLISDLIMWNDVAKSSLWFGFGSLCFLSSCFAKGFSFSVFSLISQFGLLVLGVKFFTNSICQRDRVETKSDIKLKEDDIVRASRLILPAANLAISKMRVLFSGEPSMTIKVAPFLLVGAEYGHLITLWRLCALGFFVSFTCPKLYSCYSAQVNKKVEYMRWKILDAWGACSHKKVVAASAATAFWNLTSIKTRIFAAFISLVIVRYYRQHIEAKMEERETEELGEQEQQLVLVESKSNK